MRTRITELAREWVGTPFRGGEPVLGEGADALGLVRAVGLAAGVLVQEPGLARAMESTYGGEGWLIQAWCDVFLRPVNEPAEGDVALLALEPDQLANHLALYVMRSGRPYLIHAQDRPGRVKATGERLAKVIEHSFAGVWPARVAAWYRFPGLAE